MKKFFIFVFFVMIVLNLAACGKMAKPMPYPESGYPHTYPYDNN